MIGLGTLINTVAVAAGGMLGVVIKKGLKQEMQMENMMHLVKTL